MWLRTALLVLALVFFARGSAAFGPQQPFEVGFWRGGAYTDDKTGAFSHCAAAVTYQSGITMFVFGLSDYSWGLGFAEPSWTLTKGRQIPITLRFDSGEPVAVAGVVIGDAVPVVRVPMPSNSTVLNSFRGATEMVATAEGRNYTFRLDGTSRLMVAIADCVRAGAVAQTNATPKGTTTDLALEEMQLATNFILASRLPNAKVLSRSEAPANLAAFGTTWRSDAGFGAVKIMPAKEGQTGPDIASEVISADAQACKGKFASARSSELVDNDVVTQATTGCVDAQGDREVGYFIVPWHKTSFALFGIIRGAPATDQNVGAEDDTFRKAALSSSR
jgi:hypothetical protein